MSEKKKTKAGAPIRIDSDTWFYVEPKGLCVVRDVRDYNGDYMRTDQFYIRWQDVARAQELRKVKP